MSEQDERIPGAPWLRAAEINDVSFPDRTIELIVIPYDTPADVTYAGRIVQETVRRGAFKGLERRANRIRVNREHERMHTVGRAARFHPDHAAGLLAEIRIAQTDKGDETLELAADGCLDASAAFLPMKNGMTWNGPDAYEITRAWLGHIAMTSEPAYEDAKVLAVRSAAVAPPPASSTPNLDTVRAWRLESLVLDR